MKKKFGSILMAGVLACTLGASLAISGCGGSKVPELTMPEGGYDGRKVEITFANTTGQKLNDEIVAAISRFNETYPNIKVNIDNGTKNWSDFHDKIATQITGGKQPNVAYCYSDHVALYNRSKSVIALDEYFLPGSGYEDVKSTTATGTVTLGLTQAEKDDYIDAFFAEGSNFEDGHTYTIPFAKSTEVLFYNKTFFDANNLTVPTTWDEMEEVCKRITEIDNNCIALGYDSEDNLFITMCEQLGSDYTSYEGDHYIFDNQDNRKMVEKLKTWCDNRYLTTKGTYGTYSSNLFPETAADKVKCYMSIGSTGGSSYQAPGSTDGQAVFEVGVAPIPQIDKNNPKTILQGPSVCIFKKENAYEVLASWLLVKFLSTDIAFQGKFSEVSGYAPVTKSTFNSDTYQEFLSEAGGNDAGLTAQAAKICWELSQKEGAFYTSPAFRGSAKAREQVGLLLVSVLKGQDTIDVAFKKAVQECKQLG